MFENTSENSELHDEDQEVTSPSKTLNRSTGMFILVVFTLAALVGNCIICYLVHSKYHLKTIPNRLVLNLCWCGTFTALLNGPLMLLTTAKQDWILGSTMCQISGFCSTVLTMVSVMTLAVISFNRCCLIVYTSTAAHVFTVRSTHVMVAGIWGFSIILSLPPLIGWSTYTFVKSKLICTLDWSTEPTYTSLVLVVGVLLPFSVMIFCYYKIITKVRDNKRKIGASKNRSSANKVVSNTAISSQNAKNQSPEVSQFDSVNYYPGTQPRSLSLVPMGSLFDEQRAHRPMGKKRQIEKGEERRPSVDIYVTQPSLVEERHEDNESVRVGTVTLETYVPTTEARKLSVESCSSQGDISSAKEQEETPRHHFLETAPSGHQRVRRLSLDLPGSRSLLKVEHLEEDSSSSVSAPGQSPTLRRYSMLEPRTLGQRSLAVPTNQGKDITEPWSEPPSPKSPSSVASSLNSLCLDPAVLQQTYSMESINSASNLITSRCPSPTELRPMGEQSNASTAAFPIQKEVSPCNSVHSAPIGETLPSLRSQADVTSTTSKTRRGRARNDEMRLTVAVLVIILVFSATWLPVVVINFTEAFTNIKVHNTVSRATVFIVYFQNVLNPAIYGMMNKSFRDAIKILLRISRKQN